MFGDPAITVRRVSDVRDIDKWQQSLNTFAKTIQPKKLIETKKRGPLDDEAETGNESQHQ